MVRGGRGRPGPEGEAGETGQNRKFWPSPPGTAWICAIEVEGLKCRPPTEVGGLSLELRV